MFLKTYVREFAQIGGLRIAPQKKALISKRTKAHKKWKLLVYRLEQTR